MSLRDVIVESIRSEGPLPFSGYMEMCLYHPELGYYSRPQEKFGKAGDFYTSSDVHAVFGRLLCRQFEEMWRVLDAPAQIDLIELGPGRGLFAQDVLDWAGKKFPEFARALRYRLVESSPWLREGLKARFAGDERVSLYGELECARNESGEALIIFGNEFFDAIPVEIVSGRGELRISETNGDFVECWDTPPRAHSDWLKEYSVEPEGEERVEVATLATAWMRRIAQSFGERRGFALFIDYGYTREQQLAGRHRDTLMTFREHKVSANPYEAPGEQDITTHVNFTALQAAAKEEELPSLGLVTQSQLLMGIGEKTLFADAFESCVLPQERVKVGMQLKHLVSPEGMGERFHALFLARGVDKEKAARLSGLSFGR